MAAAEIAIFDRFFMKTLVASPAPVFLENKMKQSCIVVFLDGEFSYVIHFTEGWGVTEIWRSKNNHFFGIYVVFLL